MIKFRAWDKDESEFINIKSFGFLEDGEVWYVQAIDTKENEMNPPYFTGEDELIIMQYTGLTDKNGKEIYESDVLKANIGCAGQNVVVRWNKLYTQWRLYEGKGYTRNLPFTSIDDAEIIGNLYENPELLEGD